MAPVAPALIGVGGSLAGGLIGKKAEKKAANKAYRRQKEFAQNSIQWKAEDARKAGLHPLFAMGANTQGYQPSFMAGQDPMGSAISDSAQQLGAAYAQSKAPPPGTPQGPLGQAQLRAVNAQAARDEAAAARDLSAAKRAEQQANFTQDGNLYSSSMIDPASMPVGKVTPKGPEQRSRARPGGSRSAGDNQMWNRYQYGPRRDQWIDIPYSDEGPLEEFGPGKAMATLVRLLQNRAKSAPLPRSRKGRKTRRGTRRRRY